MKGGDHMEVKRTFCGDIGFDRIYAGYLEALIKNELGKLESNNQDDEEVVE